MVSVRAMTGWKTAVRVRLIERTLPGVRADAESLSMFTFCGRPATIAARSASKPASLRTKAWAPAASIAARRPGYSPSATTRASGRQARSWRIVAQAARRAAARRRRGRRPAWWRPAHFDAVLAAARPQTWTPGMIPTSRRAEPDGGVGVDHEDAQWIQIGCVGCAGQQPSRAPPRSGDSIDPVRRAWRRSARLRVPPSSGHSPGWSLMVPGPSRKP